ncbi:hypothetical protein ACFL5F_02755 [Planctomycetota bacterium]
MECKYHITFTPCVFPVVGLAYCHPQTTQMPIRLRTIKKLCSTAALIGIRLMDTSSHSMRRATARNATVLNRISDNLIATC